MADTFTNDTEILGKSYAEWKKEVPVVEKLVACEPASWFNPEAYGLPTEEGLKHVGLGKEDIEDAAARLRRFAPYFVTEFKEIGKTNGILESPIVAVPYLQEKLSERSGQELPGRLWLKLDSELPISGSIKARGGIYEVLHHAEQLAVENGLLSLEDDYSKLATPEMKKFYSQYKVAVGSTGNLGLSIGIMSASLGFKAAVHMSADARQWKKDKLRSHGVEVVEYEDDYSKAVEQGRKEAEGDPTCYFVDDENSTTLFCGYAVAAARTAAQLESLEVTVDEDHPLFVYLPCGVGGGPGGVAFGLKEHFGDNVHIVFAEPTHCPSMMLGVATQLHNGVSVRDFGIDNVTAADGLACARPSGFVGKAMWRLIDGFTTVSDDELYRLLWLARDIEDVRMEPSSSAGIASMVQTLADEEYLAAIGMTKEKLANANHIAWITGGSMVPEQEMAAYLEKGKNLEL